MTDNIQKLYEIAGVKKKYCGWLDMGDLDTQYEYVMCDTLKEYKETAEFSRTSYSSDNKNYMTPEIKYPPFTAEKQLELIKWLLHHKQTTQVELRFFENVYCISHCTEHEEDDAIEYVRTGSEKQFEQAIADLFNDMWQELTDDQKQEIKRILQ